MSCILVTTDFSDESKRVLGPVVELAKKLGVGLRIVHVVLDLKIAPHGAPLAPPQSSPDVAEEVSEANQKLEDIAVGLGPSGVAIETRTLVGENIVEEIVHEAGRANAQFLAISTHGRTGIRHLVMGSVAEEVARKATVPVICYPPAR